MFVTVTIDTSLPYYIWMQDLERTIIQDALNKNGYSIARVARNLGLQRTTLQEKIKKLGIPTWTEKRIQDGIQAFKNMEKI